MEILSLVWPNGIGNLLETKSELMSLSQMFGVQLIAVLGPTNPSSNQVFLYKSSSHCTTVIFCNTSIQVKRADLGIQAMRIGAAPHPRSA